MKAKRLYVQVPLAFDYTELPAPSLNAQELIIFLHGYEQKGQTLLHKLSSACPPDAMIIAPNGPFPVPRRTATGFKVGYSWYFYNPNEDTYLIDMKTSTEALRSAIEAMRLTSIPKRIIGFSQGGYFAPFAALALENVKHIIGIGCDYLIDELPNTLNFRWDGIHGSKDEVVLPEGSQKSHSRLKDMGVLGEYHLLEGVGHELNDEVVKKLKLVIQNNVQA